jgi:flavodoxin
MSERNPIRAALKEPAHIIGVGAVCAATFALLNPIPLAAGVIAEAAYLLFVPTSNWYRSRLDRADVLERKAKLSRLRDDVVASLGQEIAHRYERLEATRTTIMQSRADGSGLSSGDLDLKLDLLQQRFLEFASQRHNFSQHLKQVLDQLWSRNIDSGKYSGKGPMTNGRGTTEDVAAQINTFLGQDLATVTRDVAKTDDDSEKEILTQRQGVIQRRMDQLDKIAKAVSNIDKQMQLLEDTFGLIGDETHAQAPETIVTDVEEAVARSDALTKTIAELRPLQLAQ